MGKEKRLFLLAVMTVMMSTAGYGAVIEMPKEVNKNTNGITVKEGDVVGPGSIIAETQETDSILHKSMVPPNLTEATVIHAAADGEYTILEPIVTVQQI